MLPGSSLLLACALAAAPVDAGPTATPKPAEPLVAPSAVGASPLAAIEREQQRLFESAAPAVVFIRQSGGFGSGFFVRPDGLILTNAHVVGEDKTVTVITLDGKRLTGTVLEKARDKIDLALVKVDLTGAPTLALDAFSDVRVGGFAATVGHGEGAIWTFNVGMISNIHPSGSEHPVLQTQMPVNPGNSGGPVLNLQGRVIGVVTAGIRESNSINFAIRSDVAARAFDALTELTGGYLVVTAATGAQVFLDGALIGLGPRVAVRCSDGRHELMVVEGGKMKQRTFEFPKERALAAP